MKKKNQDLLKNISPFLLKLTCTFCHFDPEHPVRMKITTGSQLSLTWCVMVSSVNQTRFHCEISKNIFVKFVSSIHMVCCKSYFDFPTTIRVTYFWKNFNKRLFLMLNFDLSKNVTSITGIFLQSHFSCAIPESGTLLTPCVE